VRVVWSVDPPAFVAVAARAPVLVHGEILRSPLTVDPADGAGDGLLVIAPREAPPHVETALEVRVGAGRPQEHHLPSEESAAERSGRPARLGRQPERTGRSVRVGTR